MKSEWAKACLRMARRKADFYTGCRKIIEDDKLVFMDLWAEGEDRLELADSGYTRNKLAHLVRGYLHEESKAAAIFLWDLRRKKPSYGSVGISTYNHMLKNDAVKKSKRASVMGPCIQSIIITQINKKQYKITAFYRTTELLKKFPADLVFIRDVLLKGFNFEGMEFMGMTCHFSNITVHPQYFSTLIPALDDPIAEFERLKERDKYFFEWCVKWTSRYLVPKHFRGIEKFAQAMRVKMDADKRITGKLRKKLEKYLDKNHPGHARAYKPKDEIVIDMDDPEEEQ